MFSKSHTSASATGAQRTDEVAKLSIWRERVEKEARQYENFPKHAYAPNPRTLVMLPEKPTAVSFESRCPRPAAIATASSSSACVNGSGNSNGSANASFTQSGQGRSATLAAAGLDATARNGGNNSTMSSTGRGNGSNMGRTGGKSGRLDSATVAALREELFSTMHRSLLPPQARHPFPASSNQEYGWFPPVAPKRPAGDDYDDDAGSGVSEALRRPEDGGFHRGLKSSEVTLFADSYTLNWGVSPFAATAGGVGAGRGAAGAGKGK